MIIISFSLSLLLFLGVGLVATLRRRADTDDYLLAGRNVSPWLIALSAAATANSGFMFIGMIGETYRVGLSSAWVMAGWLLGDYMAWRSGVPERLRVDSERTGANTIPGYLAAGNDTVRKVTAAIILVFLGAYAAAQLTAGSKALEAMFGWHHSIGALLGGVIVLAYCAAGGIRASIWTDAAQSVVMLGAMAMLATVGVQRSGGFESMFATLAADDGKLVSLAPAGLRFGVLPFVIGWFFAGFGVLGQPHVMVRAMAIDSPHHVGRARRIYIAWNLMFAAAAIVVGLGARAILPFTAGFDPELALPALSMQLLPPFLVGVMLAGVFAATMSTADSQILCCGAALSQDIFPAHRGYRAAKVSTVLIMLAVMAVAMLRVNVFGLVGVAWASLAASLGPLLVLRALGRAPAPRAAVAMTVAGIAGVALWRASHLSHHLYDVVPGIVASMLVYGASRAKVAVPAVLAQEHSLG
jgi:sodium/proline symporter